MKISHCLFIAVACILASNLVLASDVVVLTEQNFDGLTATGDWLVEFYAPWCGHCKKLAPIYEEVATKLKGTANVAKVDCTVHKALQDRFGIRGFPTIKFLKDGKLYDYKDKRELPSFVSYVEGNYMREEAKPIPAAVAAVQEPPAPPAEPAAPRTGSDVVVLTSANFDEKTAEGDWLLEFYAPWCGHCKSLAPTYESVATALLKNVHVAKIDCTAEEDLRARFNIKGYPTIKFLKEGKLYEYQGARTGEALITFVTTGFPSANYERMDTLKAVPASKKSEVKSAAKGPSDVVELTDSNYDDKLAEGVWLVEFFAPWCGHCKHLAPTYEKVATTLKGEANVAKVDCTQERGICDRNGIRGFPTIQLFRDGMRYEYKGDRTVGSFQDFVRSGWKDVTGEVPGSRNVFKEKLIDIVNSLESLLRVNIYLVIGGCVFVGIFLGVIIVILTAPKAAPPAQQQNATGTPAEETEEEDDGHTKKD